jgi:hypothetical protein
MIAAHNCREAHQSSAIQWKAFKIQNWFHITTAFQLLSYSSENCQNWELDFSHQQQPSPFSKSQLPLNLWQGKTRTKSKNNNSQQLLLISRYKWNHTNVTISNLSILSVTAGKLTPGHVKTFRIPQWDKDVQTNCTGKHEINTVGLQITPMILMQV